MPAAVLRIEDAVRDLESDVLRADGLVPLMLGLMRTEKHEKVLEKIATSDRATIVIERQAKAKCALRQGFR
jgi:hypothetical protein